MSCCGDREKQGQIKNEQKWDYINLDDFRAQSCVTPFSYGFLWFLMFVSIGVYAVDLFTACNLLFFDRWSGQVQPVIPFKISRWIFAGCIILTWILLAYRLQRAIRAIKTGSVTKCYLDPLAVRIQSIRISKNDPGWKKFLVFAALTRGRKGAEYVALFTYFTFEAWLRICFAEGPRYVINALTLYSVLKAKLIPVGAHKPDHGHTPVVQFFVNVQILANQNKEQAAILFGMLYTLIIWIFSALSLMMAVLFYLLFLWHHIPSRDGSLSKYCKRKIEKRLHTIVMDKVNKALAKQDKKRAENALANPGFAGTAQNDVKRQPTLPLLDDNASVASFPTTIASQQKLPSNFAPFEARPSSRNDNKRPLTLSREPTLPDLAAPSSRPSMPSRQTTQSSAHSNASYASDAPLMSQAAGMGHGGEEPSRSESRNRPYRMDSDHSVASRRPPPGRSYTGQSSATQRSQTPRVGPPLRQNTDMSSLSASTDHSSRAQGRQTMSRDPSNVSSRRPMYPPSNPHRPFPQEFEMQPSTPGSTINNRPAAPPSNPGGFEPYQPFNPSRPLAPIRNFTMPYNPTTPGDYFNSDGQPPRLGTAPVPRSADFQNHPINAPVVGQPPRDMPMRPATAEPRPGQPGGYHPWASRLPPPRW